MMRDSKLNEEIAHVAYMLFENSGRLHGRDLENWLEAERIVMERREQEAAGKKKKTAKPKAAKNK